MKSTALTIFSPTLQSAQPLACRLFEAALTRGKVANAYLLVGRAADTKLEIAQQVAAFANCQNAAKDERGSCLAAGGVAEKWCTNCRWIADGKHPQGWMTIAGEGKSQKIPVEKVRALTEELSKTSTFVRVIVVPDADDTSFHRPAANALLKSIEEPPPNCLFFFFADSTDDVLATIVSRCQVVPVNRAMHMGYWKAQPDDGLDAEAIKKLEAARAEFVMNARNHFGAPTSTPYLRAVGEGAEISRHLQDLCKQLQEYIDEYDAAERTFDLFVSTEIEVLKENAYNDAACTRYISRVCDLAEKCKRQIRDYVKAANAIDSFCFALTELRQSHSGEISSAKR